MSKCDNIELRVRLHGSGVCIGDLPKFGTGEEEGGRRRGGGEGGGGHDLSTSHGSANVLRMFMLGLINDN